MKSLRSLLLVLIFPLSLRADTTQEALDKVRLEKLNAIALAVVEGDAKDFRKILDDGRNVLSKDATLALLNGIHSGWGDVSLVATPATVPNLSKSTMKVVAHKSFETTSIGRFVTVKSVRDGDRVLRIYLQFPKGQSRIGAFTAAEFPRS